MMKKINKIIKTLLKIIWIIILITTSVLWCIEFNNWYFYKSLEAKDSPENIIVILKNKSWNYIINTKTWEVKKYIWEIKNNEEVFWEYTYFYNQNKYDKNYFINRSKICYLDQEINDLRLLSISWFWTKNWKYYIWLERYKLATLFLKKDLWLTIRITDLKSWRIRQFNNFTDNKNYEIEKIVWYLE